MLREHENIDITRMRCLTVSRIEDQGLGVAWVWIYNHQVSGIVNKR